MKVINNDVILVCDKCFNEMCKCKNRNIIEIDKNIYKIIKILNDKGYNTLYCCEGHTDRDIFDLYILFDGYYDFISLPKNLKFTKLNHNFLLYYTKTINNRKKINNKKKELLQELLTWSINLPNIL